MHETITLTTGELNIAYSAAVMRHVYAVKQGRNGRYGGPAKTGDALARSAVGCLGEVAVAKYLDAFWDGMYGSSTGMKDVAGYQVRATEVDGGHLILNEPDDETDVFILVTGVADKQTLRGWIYGGNGKEQKYWKSGMDGGARACYMVPQAVLSPMSTLPVLFEEAEEFVF